MPLRGSSAVLARPSGSQGHSRGTANLVTLRVNDALAASVEGVALCDEGLAAMERLQVLAATGDRRQVVDAAGRFGRRLTVARAEFRRLAGELEGAA